jgi:uncharacterized protein YjbI with pentapeptide repeats
MSSASDQTKRRPRFTIRTALTMTLLAALMFGWYLTVQRTRRQLNLQANRLRYAEEELERTRDRLADQLQPRSERRRVLWEFNLDGANLAGVKIESPGNAFQRASLQDANLENASLEGGGSSFQFARFDNSKLINAKLTGGGSSFQEATFVGADLTGAVLAGGGASFQGSSFENARLDRSQLTGSFQLSNISGAHFEGADLSGLDGDSLASCYFKKAPTYSAETTFPADFDPKSQGWRLVAE